MKRGFLVWVVLIVIFAAAASYAWNRWLEHDIGHDVPHHAQPPGP